MSWPLYTASAHVAYGGRHTWLVVLALDPKVAEWAARPIATYQGGSFVPCVIGPSQIPRIDSFDLARERPELAVLSALVHAGSEHGVEVTMAAIVASEVVGRRDEGCGKLYMDAVMDAAGDVAKKALEAVMRIQGYEYKSEFARKYVQQGRDEGLRLAVEHLCAGLGIEWSADRAAHVETLDAARLMALVDTLSTRRAWPDAG